MLVTGFTYLDREAFLHAQNIIQGVDQSLSNTYTLLKNNDFRTLMDAHDYYDELSQAMSRFVTAKRRIGNLYAAMKDYLVLWDEAQGKAKRNANGVLVTSDKYSHQLFWNLYTDAILAGKSVYSDSKAWRYATYKDSSFSERYNDFNNFRYKSGLWPEVTLWARDIGSWRKTTLKSLNPESYYEPKRIASIEAMLKGLPGYAELDTVNTNIIDWDELGKKCGVPGLKTLAKKLAKLGEKGGKTLGDEDFAEVIEGLRAIGDQWADSSPGKSKAIQMIADGLDAINAQGLEGAGKGLDKVIKIQEYAEFGLKMVLHCASDHSQQVEYLQNAREALLAAGYDESGLVSDLSYLQTLYENDELYVAQKSYDKLKELGVDAVDKAIGKLEVVKWVDLGYGGAGTAANILAGDKIKAADSLMGIMQYDGALTKTFDNYAEMIRAGVATQEDITRADQVFEMLCTSKITGYENMKTIIGDKTHPAYIMAETKIKELKIMMNQSYTSPQQQGSSGGYSSGGGRWG